ncbi:MAG: hypothetical protein K6T81_19080 [Alicyclobacillus macrosporangiidus]|uniref:hypothetical protein n=1 Tax=Alicyclobacillus macrosporangiidus TaxID=392015 RepID=UPI0026E9D45F|nr:hypothetical protein [Alicyclobacillus macrosporangiidus]MCL6600816.1 hypothetical protein [Alicyclobacillus macrosporangiidus]
MEQFRRKFKEAHFDGDVYLRPVRIEETQDNLQIQFNACLEYSDQLIQEWTIECTDLIDYNLTLDFIDDINVYTDHVLLWSKNTEHCQLFFKGKPDNPYEVVGALYAKHEEVTNGWIKFDTFLNGLVSVDKLLSRGNGLFAEGPEELLKSYKSVLENFMVSTSMLPSKHDTHREQYQVMVFGKSYVVAKGFTFHLLSDKTSI